VSEFRKKPVVIQAVQFTGDNADEIGHFAGLAARIAGRGARLEIQTLEGVMTASPGDWIIRGVKGEFYPCKPDIFDASYEPCGAPSPGGSQ
jgi:hypothetical protein